jgi:DNA-binding CsgD family transcriptional regulator
MPSKSKTSAHSASEHLNIPQYYELSKNGRWDVLKTGSVIPIRTNYQNPILQERVNPFWNALRDGITVPELIPFFDNSLTSGIREEILKYPNSAMSALGSYDLRFADSVGYPVILKVLNAWLKLQTQAAIPNNNISESQSSLTLPKKLGSKKTDVSKMLNKLGLTSRQYEIASLKIEYGLSGREIARRLGLNLKTVQEHLKAFRKKADAKLIQ